MSQIPVLQVAFGIAVDQACQALTEFVALPLDRGSFSLLLTADGQPLPVLQLQTMGCSSSALASRQTAKSSRSVLTWWLPQT